MSDTFTICFRLPIRFRAPLTKLAKAAHGSINQQVVMAIEAHMANEMKPYIRSRIVRGLTVRNPKAPKRKSAPKRGKGKG